MRTRLIRVDPENPDPGLIRQAAATLRRGGLVAFPTETVYGLGANLDDPQAIQELYQIKQRPFEKQVTIHLASASDLEKYPVRVTDLGRELARVFWPGPLTLVFARPDGSTLGFRVPRHPVAAALLKEAAVPVVAPSANVSGMPPALTAAEVAGLFMDKIDWIIDGGPAPLGVGSTVLDLSGESPSILREGAMAAEVERFLG